jgi:hypothetical protein
MESVYKRLGKFDERKAEKLAKINSTLPPEDWEEPNIVDFYITEKSLKEGFEKVFGAKCDIFAMLLYIRGS